MSATRSTGVWFAMVGVLLSAGSAAAVDNGDVPVNTPASARRMIEDLVKTHGDQYRGGKEYLRRLGEIEAKLKGDGAAKAQLDALIREASLANPLLDVDRILVIRRKGEANRRLNSHTSDTIKRTGWDNEISELSNLRGQVKVRTVYRHPNKSVMKHMDLHFDGNRIMFSGVGANGSWAILQVDKNGRNLRELSPDDQEDVQWFDGCYLPKEGQIVTCSTAGMQGLPCENGGRPMVNLYRVDTRTRKVQQLTFEQDSDWHPRVHHNGRVMYLRWEYTDTPHYYSRHLFHMNPDGTGQIEYWGSGSYFPTAYVWARPVPNHSSMVVGIVSGHHAKSETGRLLLIDPELGRKYPLRYTPKEKSWGPEKSTFNLHPEPLPATETGCLQEIPGYGRNVVGNIYDGQGGGQKYTFGTPWPLSDKYFLVSMKDSSTGKGGRWSLYLVDVFDNMTLVYDDPEYSLFEPIPLAARPKPPVAVDRRIDGAPAFVFCTDIYNGPGLKDIPRGTVKKLRVFSYHYGYIKSGGHASCGLEAGWDIKRIHGTVEVETDGSFSFQMPANTPFAIQPLDADGAAIALMRSWMVGMPGEKVSCNGCHEDHRRALPAEATLASQRRPRPIEPWYGPIRPFSYATEVQPMLNEYCLGCHNEAKRAAKGMISFEKTDPGSWQKDQSYLNLVAFARRPGPESDLDLFNAMEWHVSTSPLIQMLRKGHHGVKLDAEAWDRLITWIDLNAPHRGMWNNEHFEKRRMDLARLYAGVNDNPEDEHRTALAAVGKLGQIKPIIPAKSPRPAPDGLKASGFPFDTTKAKQLQGDEGAIPIMLPNGLEMKFVRIPAGEFVMGSQAGYADEAPRAAAKIAKAFWMGVTEVTNKQYRAFDPKHDTRYLDENGKDHSTPGYIANHPDQPVARVSWQEATAFCQWLSKHLNKTVTLPTEAQWEWAARAGTAAQFYYGDADTDFGPFANLADSDRRNLASKYDGGSKTHIRRPYPADSLYPLRDDRFKDNWFVVDYVAQCQPNAWGLMDMVGNVSEWTRSSYRPYPYVDGDGRNDGKLDEKKVARGGSWNDRPKDAGASVRFPFESYQKVYNVGFRAIIEE